MEIDAKVVGVFVWKIIRFVVNKTCIYVRQYPVVSGVSTLVFLLYTFLPRVFYFLLCSSPLIAFAAFYLRNHVSLNPWNIDFSTKETKTVKGSSSSVQKGSDSDEDQNRKAYLRPQRSVRRNARRKVEEVGKEWDSLQASEDETDRVILTTLYGELPNPNTQDFKKLKKDKTLLVAEEILLDHVSSNTVLDSFEEVTSGDGGEIEMEISSSSSSSEEEESHEKINKAVAWTADDQKNLTDLGTSEIERNKRLENMIARRRSRRLFLLAAERSLRGMGIPSICVERNYFGLNKEYYDIDELQMPGSAPSVLLPTRNPFDLPYDPQEEKPNLSGDSFLQEFSVGNQKDIFLCRHESFCRGVFPSENQQLEPRKKVIDGHGFFRIKPRQDGLVVEQEPLTKEGILTRTEGNNIKSNYGLRSEVQTKTGATKNEESDSSSDKNSKTYCKQKGDHIGNSLAGLVPKNNVSSSLGVERQRYMEHFGYNTNRRHMVTHSVDSDLQVEVSEIGSPPTTVDENDYSDDCESEVGRDKGFCDDEAEKSSLSFSPENNVSKRFEGSSNVTDVHDRSMKDDRSSSTEFHNQCPSDNSNVTPMEETVTTQPDEESLKPYENSADEIKISYESDEAEPSERTDQESQGNGENNNGDQLGPVMEEVVETEASDVEHGNSDESVPSPRSVLPDVLSLDQTYSLHSEDLQNISDGHYGTVNEAPESLQNQSARLRNTEEPESTFHLDSAMTVSEESNAVTGMDAMENLCTDKSESTESNEVLNPHENVDSFEQRMFRDEHEAVGDIHEESKITQELQLFVDSTAKELENDQSTVTEKRTYILNPEDDEFTLEDRFQNQFSDKMNIDEPEEQCGPSENVNPDALTSIEKKQEGSLITLSEESRIDDPMIIEKLYKESSKSTQSSENQVQFQTKGITEEEESKTGDKADTLRDVQEEDNGSLVDPSTEEIKRRTNGFMVTEEKDKSPECLRVINDHHSDTK